MFTSCDVAFLANLCTNIDVLVFGGLQETMGLYGVSLTSFKRVNCWWGGGGVCQGPMIAIFYSISLELFVMRVAYIYVRLKVQGAF